MAPMGLRHAPAQLKRLGESIASLKPACCKHSGNPSPRTNAALAWPIAGDVWIP